MRSLQNCERPATDDGAGAQDCAKNGKSTPTVRRDRAGGSTFTIARPCPVCGSVARWSDYCRALNCYACGVLWSEREVLELVECETLEFLLANPGLREGLPATRDRLAVAARAAFRRRLAPREVAGLIVLAGRGLGLPDLTSRAIVEEVAGELLEAAA